MMEKKNIIHVYFPSREEERLSAINSLSRDGVKMLLCHGISNHKNAFVCDCGKKDCKSAGKHPIQEFFPNGEHSATSEEAYIKKALKKYPNANLAVAVDGFFVIDVDGPEGMKFVKGLSLPPTFRVKTGRGCHYYFKGKLPDNLKKLEQIDLKTKGYVMFAGSRHKSGVYYRRAV